MNKISDSKIIQGDINYIASELKNYHRDFSGKTILIAGGAGFLGRYLVLTLDFVNKEYISSNPCKVIVLDNFITGLPDAVKSNKNIKVIKHDVSKPLEISDDVDYILHAASLASPIFYNKFKIETIDAGILGTKNLLELAKEKKVKGFMFFSSSEVYGDPDPKFIPTNEEYRGNVSCTGPRACYDEPKRIGETLCMAYAEVHNIPISIIRPFNIFGPGMRLDDGRVLSNYIVAALKGKKIPIYGRGTQTRTFCYISNAIIGIYQVLFSKNDKAYYNIGSDEQEISMRSLAELVSGLIDHKDTSIQNVESPNDTYSPEADPNRRCPDLTKIRTMVGYNPKINLVTGIKRFIEWVKEELEMEAKSYGPQTSCRSCGNPHMKITLSLGKTPLANKLLPQNDMGDDSEGYPLELMYCDSCHLCQLSYVVPSEKMFDDYLYVSSTTETFRQHFGNMAESLTRDFNLNEKSLAVDIGSNDGLLLKKFKSFGINVVGIEPAKKIAQMARSEGVDTLDGYFNEKNVEHIINMKGKADIVTCNNTFAHVPDGKGLMNNVKKLLKDNGVFVIEVQYLLDTINDLSFDNIYHEHIYYFSTLSLRNVLEKNGLKLFKVQHVDTHGGSLRAYVQKESGKNPLDPSVEEFIKKETDFGLDRLETYLSFSQKVNNIKSEVRNFINNVKQEGKTIIGYGAPAKATTILNYYGIGNNQIDEIIEDNKLKHGLYVPGVKIPIVAKENLKNKEPDYVVILAWNFANEIIKNNRSSFSNSSKYMTLSPKLAVLNALE